MFLIEIYLLVFVTQNYLYNWVHEFLIEIKLEILEVVLLFRQEDF